MLQRTTAMVVKLFFRRSNSGNGKLNSPVFAFVHEVAYTVFLVIVGNRGWKSRICRLKLCVKRGVLVGFPGA